MIKCQKGFEQWFTPVGIWWLRLCIEKKWRPSSLSILSPTYRMRPPCLRIAVLSCKSSHHIHALECSGVSLECIGVSIWNMYNTGLAGGVLKWRYPQLIQSHGWPWHPPTARPINRRIHLHRRQCPSPPLKPRGPGGNASPCRPLQLSYIELLQPTDL